MHVLRGMIDPESVCKHNWNRLSFSEKPSFPGQSSWGTRNTLGYERRGTSGGGVPGVAPVIWQRYASLLGCVLFFHNQTRSDRCSPATVTPPVSPLRACIHCPILHSLWVPQTPLCTVGGWGTALCPRVSEERGKKRSWFHNAVAALHNAE